MMLILITQTAGCDGINALARRAGGGNLSQSDINSGISIPTG